MTNPPPILPAPTYNPVSNPGRLATDRYDFELHIEGKAFRHNATHIDLFPALVFDGYGLQTTVQGALNALSNLINPPPVPNATTSSLGIVQLAGDIGGVATNVVVTQIQGKPINTLVPNLNDVLTWNGSAWGPSPSLNAFSANGDLSGTNVLQRVIGLTGTSGVVSAVCNTINFGLGTVPLLTQTTNSSGNGIDFTIRAQASSLSGGNGGNVVLSGGTRVSGLGAVRGGAKLQLDGYTLVQLNEVLPGQRILSLVGSGNVTSTDMPSGSGDRVIYIRDVLFNDGYGSFGTIPVTPPNNGTVVFSNGGQLWVQQSNGTQFAVGSVPNPSVWGTNGQQTITYRDFAQSPPMTSVTMRSFALSDNATTRIDVIIQGKDITTNDAAQFNFTIGFTRNAGSSPATSVGSSTPTSSDPRFTPGAGIWPIPTIVLTGSGTSVSVLSGRGANTISWFSVTQVSIVSNSGA